MMYQYLKKQPLFRLRCFKKICLMSIAYPMLLTNVVFAQNTQPTNAIEANSTGSEIAGEKIAVTDKKQQIINEQIDRLNQMRANGPVAWVRSLQVLQDNTAAGQAGAFQLQPILLNEIGDKMLAANVSTWDNPENVYALLIYLFNGGNPKVVESIIKIIPDAIISKELLDGALAYARNRQTTFVQSFSSFPVIDSELPIALRVSIALVSAEGISEKNPSEAMKMLNFVRLSAPGSLFEEAALRRQVKVAVLADKPDMLQSLARNYVARFVNSPYANEFWRDFSVAVPQVEYEFNDEKLQSLVSMSPIIVQFIIYMQVSRDALLDARMQRAHFGAEKSMQIAKFLKLDDSAARLYYAASFAGTTSASKAADVLNTISMDKLPKRDQPLLVAAQSIAKDVMNDMHNWPFPSEDQSEDNSKGQDPFEVLAQLPVAAPDSAEPDNNLPENYTDSDELSMKLQAAQFADEIDKFVKDTQEKIEDVDKLLETKK